MKKFLLGAMALCLISLTSHAQVKNGSTWTRGNVTVTVRVWVHPTMGTGYARFSQTGGLLSPIVPGSPSIAGGKALDDSLSATTTGAPSEPGGSVTIGETFRVNPDSNGLGEMQTQVKGVWKTMKEDPLEEVEKSSNGPGGVGTLPHW